MCCDLMSIVQVAFVNRLINELRTYVRMYVCTNESQVGSSSTTSSLETDSYSPEPGRRHGAINGCVICGNCVKYLYCISRY